MLSKERRKTTRKRDLAKAIGGGKKARNGAMKAR